jgi:uncharacterized protein YbjT (DUF2867 family)
VKVLVTGATGHQGGSVARALIARGHEVLAMTRKPQSAAARALAAAGAQVVQGDLEDVARLRELASGTEATFGVTNYWEHFDREVVHGKNIIDACSLQKGHHLVLSTLASAAEATKGEVRVPHVETKREIELYAIHRGAKATFVHVAFYYENFLTWFAPRRGPDGRLAFGFPQGDTPLATVSADDVGPVVVSLLEQGDAVQGRTFGIVGDEQPCSMYASVMSRLLGETVTYQHVPREVFSALGFPGAEDLAAMFDYQRRFVGSRQADLTETRRRHPGTLTFEAWAEANLPALQRIASSRP